MSLTNDLHRIFRDHLQVEVPDNDMNLMENGIIDSLALVNLILAIEEEFQVSISLEETDLQNFETINKLNSLILELRGDTINASKGGTDYDSTARKTS